MRGSRRNAEAANQDGDDRIQCRCGQTAGQGDASSMENVALHLLLCYGTLHSVAPGPPDRRQARIETMRSFNTAGPVNATDHYLIAPLSRIDLDEVLGLVRDKKYFVLHALRQTGKTSALLALADVLNERGYGCVYVTVETARTARDDVQRAMRTVLVRLASQARATLDDGFLDDIWPDVLARVGADEALGEALSRWAEASPLPLVLLIDEIDALVGDSLLSVLQQIRAGYPGRPARFPHSVVLCGMRDLRDYRMGAAGSPFNIAAKSLRLDDFSREQTQALLGQHTEETGQAFAPEALEAVWTQTRGQPWLVNALAYGTCFKNRALRDDRSRTVTVDDIAAARDDLIVNRANQPVNGWSRVWWIMPGRTRTLPSGARSIIGPSRQL